MNRNQNTNTAPARDYEVGYGKPPVHTRFKKGQSGNPNGRRPGDTRGRARRLVLDEAYRLVAVREGENVISLPALQVVLRSQIAQAAKGNVQAQRAFLKLIESVEREVADDSDLRRELQELKADRAREEVLERARARIIADFDYVRP